jgi:hypothetical protein
MFFELHEANVLIFITKIIKTNQLKGERHILWIREEKLLPLL